MQYDMHHNVKDVLALAPQNIAGDGTVNGPVIDLNNFDSAELEALAGAITDGTHTVVLEEDDNVGFASPTAVAALDILGSLPVFTSAEANTSKRFGYRGHQRYIRVSITSTGVTTGGFFAGGGMLGHPRHAPVAE